MATLTISTCRLLRDEHHQPDVQALGRAWSGGPAAGVALERLDLARQAHEAGTACRLAIKQRGPRR